jgi:benzodiazapine receptor
MILRIVLFLIINFAGLGLGGLFTGDGVSSDWYSHLNKAPWTPPGWVFGAAWTTIMICFAIYMSFLWESVENRRLLITLFALQWVLNFAWNPVFFHYQAVLLGLIVISALTLLVGFFLFNYWSSIKVKSLLIAPYLLWLLIATSLNAYVWVNN